MTIAQDIVFAGAKVPLVSVVVLVLEIIFVCSLYTGWYFGARRLDISLHHWMVYGVTIGHFIVFLLVMLPGALKAAPFVLADPLGRIIPFLHWTFGLLSITLSLTITTIFAFKRDIPLGVLRRIRPLMITTLISWTITFLLGLLVFITVKMKPIG